MRLGKGRSDRDERPAHRGGRGAEPPAEDAMKVGEVIEAGLKRDFGDFGTALSAAEKLSRAAMKERSTKETLIVGTRTEKPSSLPFNSGSTSPTAAAAPVLVGIIDIVAERARRRSSW